MFKLLKQTLAAALLASYVFCASATTHVNDSGTWRQLQGVYVNDAGTWREIQEIYINDAGTWRSVFTNAVVTVSGETISDINLAFASFAVVRFRSSGIVEKDTNAGLNVQIDSSTDWVIPNAAGGANYEIRATVTVAPGGSGTWGGAAFNTWFALSSNREWSLNIIGDAADSGTLLIEIRSTATGTVLDSGSYVFNVDGIPL